MNYWLDTPAPLHSREYEYVGIQWSGTVSLYSQTTCAQKDVCILIYYRINVFVKLEWNTPESFSQNLWYRYSVIQAVDVSWIMDKSNMVDVCAG